MVGSRTVRRKAIKRQGFVLIAMCATLFLLLGMMGLAFDLGRVYVAHNEAQVYTDAAALTAATKLDGTVAGLDQARAAVEGLPGRWNFGSLPITGAVVEFSADGRRWVKTPLADTPVEQLKFVRVAAPPNAVPIAFLRAVGTPSSMQIAVASVASSSSIAKRRSNGRR